MPLSVRLDAESEERLAALAERTGRSKTFYVREAILAHLDELEEIYWVDEIVTDWIAQGRPSRPAEEFWAEFEE